MRTLKASLRLSLLPLLLPSLGILAGAAACGGAAKPPATAPAPAPPAAKNVFVDAPAYASAPVARSASAAHAAKGAVAPGNKTACLSCHKAGGAAPAFSFAGTVFADTAATKGGADVEVRVLDGKGQSLAVHSDADGNFWLAGAPVATPIHAGVRNGATTALMEPDVNNGDCNDCHDAKLPLVIK
jgi:hypothetical protein